MDKTFVGDSSSENESFYIPIINMLYSFSDTSSDSDNLPIQKTMDDEDNLPNNYLSSEDISIARSIHEPILSFQDEDNTYSAHGESDSSLKTSEDDLFYSLTLENIPNAKKNTNQCIKSSFLKFLILICSLFYHIISIAIESKVIFTKSKLTSIFDDSFDNIQD